MLATIDDNLLIVNSSYVVEKTKMKGLMNTRPDGNRVKLNYKEKGWFTDDWHSVLL
jgi:hypothetical protein